MIAPVQLWVTSHPHAVSWLYDLALHVLGDTGIISEKTYAHPNFFMLKPVDEDKEITLPSTRHMLSFCKTTPAYNLPRLVGIPDADTLNRQSSNALLKILEEPPKRTFIVLIAHTPAQILPTLLSRCTRIRLESDEDAHAWIKQHPKAPSDHDSAYSFHVKKNDDEQVSLDARTRLLGKMILMMFQKNYDRVHAMIDALSDKEMHGADPSCPLLVSHSLVFLYQLIRAPYALSPLSPGFQYLIDMHPHAHWLNVYEACAHYIRDAKTAHIPVRDQLRGILMLCTDPWAYRMGVE